MFLLQAGQGSPDYGGLFTAILLVFLLASVGVVLLALVRRKVRNLDQSGGADFTLSDLRRLKETGEISPEEFDRAKARMVAFSHAKLAKEVEAKKGAALKGIEGLEDELKP